MFSLLTDPALLLLLLQNLIYAGDTPRGTPVYINRQYMQAELKLVVGNIEPHQFMGFSGGVKSAAVGLTGKKTINQNHALMTHPDSRLGEYENNLARQDVEAIGKIIGIHFALNAILNEKKQIVKVVAGDPRAGGTSGKSRSQQYAGLYQLFRTRAGR
ncbi:MAG: hypothetical protein DCC66_03645 [Planctomycetota bacterium]|nr:MAG: hypothetical protein DCC66_03645 [Planctomycetota bacterium]